MENTNTNTTLKAAHAVFTPASVIAAAGIVESSPEYGQVMGELARVQGCASALQIWAEGYLKRYRNAQNVEACIVGLIRATPAWNKAADAVYASFREGEVFDALREGVDAVNTFVVSANALMPMKRFEELARACERYLAFVKS